MEKIKVYYDYDMESLTVWFDEPLNEHICEELGNGIIVMKDKKDRVIGFEKLNLPLDKHVKDLNVELLSSR